MTAFPAEHGPFAPVRGLDIAEHIARAYHLAVACGVKVPHLSASQIGNAEGCLRGWGFAKLDRVQTPDTGAQADGKLGHLYAEWYYRAGVIPSVAAADPSFHRAAKAEGCPDPQSPKGQALARTATALIAAAGIPPQHPAIQVEKFWRVTFGASAKGRDLPVTFLGYMDLWAWDPSRPDAPPLVVDHKFLAGLGWAKPPEVLAERDAQSVLYATFATLATRTRENPVPTVSLQWNNAQKGSSKTLIQHATTALPTFLPRLQELVQIGRTLTALAMVPPDPVQGPDGRQYSALALPPNPKHCSAYGGCPYRAICGDLPAPDVADLVSAVL